MVHIGESIDVTWYDSATVVGDKYVYLGNRINILYFVFNLEEEQWTCLPKSSSCFPYGSLYVDGSLYYLTGRGSWKLLIMTLMIMRSPLLKEALSLMWMIPLSFSIAFVPRVVRNKLCLHIHNWKATLGSLK